MSKRSKKINKPSVDTGGAPYIGRDAKIGKYIHGDEINVEGIGNVVKSDHGSASVTMQASQGASMDDLRRLLAEMRASLPVSGLDKETAQAVENDVRQVEEQAAKPSPNKAIVLGKLKGITEALVAATAAMSAAAGAGAAAQKLLEMARQAAQWAEQLLR